MTRFAAALALALLWAGRGAADVVTRGVPPACADAPGGTEANLERAYNEHYLAVYEGLSRWDLDAVERAVCAALRSAVGFGPRDWRFAEALDELGRLEYLRGDDDASVAAQAAAVAEMLLAKGPRAPEARVYAQRLALPLRRSGRAALASTVEAEPHRVFTDGLVAVDGAMARRVDWLVSEYLALERLDVARRLQDLIARAEGRGP